MSRGRRGGAAIEFALTLPVLFLVLTSTIDIGTYLWRRVVVLNAAREGARAGADVVAGENGNEADAADLEQTAIAYAQSVLLAHGLPCSVGCVVDAQWTLDGASGIWLIETSVIYPYTPVVGLLPGMDGQVVARFATVSALQDPG